MLTYGTLAALYLAYVGVRGQGVGVLCGRRSWSTHPHHSAPPRAVQERMSGVGDMSARTDHVPFRAETVDEQRVVADEAQRATQRSLLRRSFLPTVRRWLREPLIHFLLIGAVLFAAYGYMQRGRGGVESSKQIQLTVDDLAQLILIFQAQWRRDPTPDEISRLVESKIQEEVLYREGAGDGTR